MQLEIVQFIVEAKFIVLAPIERRATICLGSVHRPPLEVWFNIVHDLAKVLHLLLILRKALSPI
jgi:hypothetical protein